MSITRAALLDLVATYGAGSYSNIDYIVTTNSDTIRLSWYKSSGRGVQWVDKDLGGGEYRTGVELYNDIPHSLEKNLEENETKTITFIEVGMIDRIAFKATVAPAWSYKSDLAFLSDLRVNGGYVVGFKKDDFSYDVVLPAGSTNLPVISATLGYLPSTMVINQASSVTGQGTVVVTAENGTTNVTYTINFSVASA